jgi:hypothetical protein
MKGTSMNCFHAIRKRRNWTPFMMPALVALIALQAWTSLRARELQISGIYPHLAMWNDQGECGTGAVVPWAGRLWVVTYSPHMPNGSRDKLYEITAELEQIIRPESIGGTAANRMVHRETNQLIIGPYVIRADRTVRTIPYSVMPGRPTANARHLIEPDRRIYFATMEEGLYEVDLHSLAVQEIFADGNGAGSQKPNYAGKDLPGYHGKGAYSGYGRVWYANNGEHGAPALQNPTIPSGALACWQPGDLAWTLIRRNQFTEITGPGGIYGNDHPGRDPIWTLGWDDRSVILGLLQDEAWSYFRLPKASHSYDGAHGWNTEWPRIREIGEGEELLATMHGTFWSFPNTFFKGNTAGIRPRSNYLKVVGDFCRWNDKLVLGCDDSTVAEFVNSRPQKNNKGTAGQSNSNLWFVAPGQLDHLGPALGRGCVWKHEDVTAGSVSDPYLFAGFERRLLHLVHASQADLTIRIEWDREGTGQWEALTSLTVPAGEAIWHVFDTDAQAEWVRLIAEDDAKMLTASLLYMGSDSRGTDPNIIFAGLSDGASKSRLDGTMWSLGQDQRKLGVAVPRAGASGHALYLLDSNLRLTPSENQEILARTLAAEQLPRAVEEDAASWIWTEDNRRYRLPKHPGGTGEIRAANPRVVREVVTERDLLHVEGSFYELPARNAGGMPFVRPISTHNFAIDDYCSYLGLLCVTGLDAEKAKQAASSGNEHVILSEDEQAAVWVGAIDDLWKLGKPRGVGGPWKRSVVKAGVPSDPYLMTGYDRKSVELSHGFQGQVELTLEVDIDGTGLWVPYATFGAKAGETIRHTFPHGFSAYWVRAVSNTDTKVTAQFEYR